MIPPFILPLSLSLSFSLSLSHSLSRALALSLSLPLACSRSRFPAPSLSLSLSPPPPLFLSVIGSGARIVRSAACFEADDALTPAHLHTQHTQTHTHTHNTNTHNTNTPKWRNRTTSTAQQLGPSVMSIISDSSLFTHTYRLFGAEPSSSHFEEEVCTGVGAACCAAQ